MANRRELLLLLGLFASLIGFAIFGPRPQPAAPGLPGSTYNAQPDGSMALLRWLGDLGYDAAPLAYQEFRLGEDVDVLFVLNVGESYTLEHADALREWVDGGGTLIVAHQQGAFVAGELLDELGASTENLTTTIERLTPSQPILSQPPVISVTVATEYVLELDRTDYAPLLEAPEGLVLVGWAQGSGYVYLSSSLHPFSNAGLGDAGSGALVLNMLRRAPPGARVLFDEYHHGFFTAPDTTKTFLSSPWGQAAVYLALLCLLYLLLTARRFGAPVPLPEQTARRSSAEYVESMAGLFQRAGQRGFVLRHFYTALKRRLARPYGLNPRLGDDEFVAELSRHRAVDEPTLRRTLRGLQQQNPSESELVRVLAEADSIRSKGD